jgi:hypothetical protein
MTSSNLMLPCTIALCILCRSISATAAEAAFIHYFSQNQELIAWRSFQQGSSEQLIVDFPEPRTLTLSQAQQLQTKLARSQKAAATEMLAGGATPMPLDEFANTTSFDPLPPELKAELAPSCLMPKFNAQQLFFQGTLTTPRFIARMSVVACRPQTAYAGAGTAFLFSPTFALTAAHVISQLGVLQDCDYSLALGGDSYQSSTPQPFGQRFAAPLQTGNLDPKSAKDSDELSNTELTASINADWALLAVGAQPSDYAAPAWPILKFSDSSAPSQLRVVKTGYPKGARTRAFRRPGASLTSTGQALCASRIDTAAFALIADSGDSGAPIWTLPADHPDGWAQIISLVAVNQRFGRIPSVYGPKMSMDLYWQLVRAISIEHK